MLKSFASAFVALCLIAGPASAQRAKVAQGPTTSELAVEVTMARQQAADLQNQMTGIMSDMATLRGRVEQLEYELNGAREEAKQVSGDNTALRQELRALKTESEAQRRTISSLEARLSSYSAPAPTYGTVPSSSSSSTTGVTRSYPSTSTSTGTTTTTTPRSTTVTRTTPAASTTRAITPSSGGTQVSAPAQTGSLGTIPASALPGDAGPLFAAAKSKLIQFDYAGAEEAFRAFLDKFGSDPQAGEAHYWLGEALYQQKAYADSGVAYTSMIRAFPDDPRAPDALVKLARAMRLTGDTEKACLALDTLPKRYPNVSGVTRDLAAVERTKSGCTA